MLTTSRSFIQSHSACSPTTFVGLQSFSYKTVVLAPSADICFSISALVLIPSFASVQTERIADFRGALIPRWRRLGRTALKLLREPQRRFHKYRARRRAQYVLRHLATIDAAVFKTVNGIRLIQYPDVIAERLLDGKLWRLEAFNSAISALQGHLRKGAFIDVGANSGMHSIYAARTNLFTKIIAIEPLLRNFELLCANLRLNEINGASPMQCALSDRDGRAPIYIDRGNFGASGFNGEGGDLELVPTRRMDGLLDELGIDPSSIGLLWINVRGHEKEALEGMKSVLEKRVPLVLILSPQAEADGAITLLRRYYEHFAWKYQGATLIEFLNRDIYSDKSRWIAVW